MTLPSQEDELAHIDKALDRAKVSLPEKKVLMYLIQESIAKARIEGKEELVKMAADRLRDDDMYTLQAFVEDAELYLAKLKDGDE